MYSQLWPNGLFSSLSTLSVICLVYYLVKAVYNVFLHPLRSFPGPRLASATYLPEFYYDVMCVGRYTREIQKMHAKYGPIVRINPDELHCNDPEFIDEIYAAGGRKRDKPIHQVNSSIIRRAGFATVEHDLHRVRRAPVSKFFSRSMIARLEEEIIRLAQKLCDKILAQGPDPFDVAVAYSNLTTDVISGYCFGEDFGLLQQNGWHPNFRDPTLATLQPFFVFRYFPFLKSLTKIGELSVLAYLHKFVDYLPETTALLVRTMQIDLPRLVKKALDDKNAGITYERPTVVGAIIDSELSAADKEPSRVAEEAFAIVGAGTETTTWALAVMTYHLLSKPHLLKKLTEELQGTVNDAQKLPSWTTLEKLPYLNAVIQEGLRLSYGVSGRTARVPIDEDLHYRGEWQKKPVEHMIPRGYAIGMSTSIAHHDETLFPDSHEFRPERWLDLDAQSRRELDRGMIAFSKGSRACLGMNLALCELHLALAALTMRVFPRMKLYETTEQDIRYDYDLLIPMAKRGSKGVRATIMSEDR